MWSQAPHYAESDFRQPGSKAWEFSILALCAEELHICANTTSYLCPPLNYKFHETRDGICHVLFSVPAHFLNAEEIHER